jgi:hypothetical protein
MTGATSVKELKKLFKNTDSFQPKSPNFISLYLFKVCNCVVIQLSVLGLIPELSKGANLGINLPFHQFDGVMVVLESWDFKIPVSRSIDIIFNF